MTESFNVLTAALKRLDTESFLSHYLELIKKGATLSLPNYESIDKSRVEWRDCLPLNCQEASDEFLKLLAERWLALIASHPSAEPLSIDDLIRLHKQSIKKSATLNSTISKQYHKEKELEAELKQPVANREDKLYQAFKKKQPFHFLDNYLAYYIEKKEHFPNTSIYKNIEEEWKKKLTQRFKKKVPSEFLKTLSATWLHLRHQSVNIDPVALKLYLRQHYAKNFSEESEKEQNSIAYKLKKIFKSKAFKNKQGMIAF